MTGYIDLAYYRDVYHGTNSSQPDINDRIMLANLIIGEAVNFVGLDKLTGSDIYNVITLVADDGTKYELSVDDLGVLRTGLRNLGISKSISNNNYDINISSNDVIIKADNGSRYKLDVDNLGILQTKINSGSNSDIVASDGQIGIIKQATCMEVDYLYAHPEAIEHYAGVSVSVGSFSISGDASSVNIPKIGVAVNALLMYGGFLNRGVCVR